MFHKWEGGRGNWKHFEGHDKPYRIDLVLRDQIEEVADSQERFKYESSRGTNSACIIRVWGWNQVLFFQRAASQLFLLGTAKDLADICRDGSRIAEISRDWGQEPDFYLCVAATFFDRQDDPKTYQALQSYLKKVTVSLYSNFKAKVKDDAWLLAPQRPYEGLNSIIHCYFRLGLIEEAARSAELLADICIANPRFRCGMYGVSSLLRQDFGIAAQQLEACRLMQTDDDEDDRQEVATALRIARALHAWQEKDQNRAIELLHELHAPWGTEKDPIGPLLALAEEGRDLPQLASLKSLFIHFIENLDRFVTYSEQHDTGIGALETESVQIQGTGASSPLKNGEIVGTMWDSASPSVPRPITSAQLAELEAQKCNYQLFVIDQGEASSSERAGQVFAHGEKIDLSPFHYRVLYRTLAHGGVAGEVTDIVETCSFDKTNAARLRNLKIENRSSFDEDTRVIRSEIGDLSTWLKENFGATLQTRKKAAYQLWMTKKLLYCLVRLQR